MIRLEFNVEPFRAMRGLYAVKAKAKKAGTTTESEVMGLFHSRARAIVSKGKFQTLTTDYIATGDFKADCKAVLRVYLAVSEPCDFTKIATETFALLSKQTGSDLTLEGVPPEEQLQFVLNHLDELR